MSECQLDASNFLFHNQTQLNSCWEEAERVGMPEDLFRRLVHGWEETRLSLDYLEAALRHTKAEGEDTPDPATEPAMPAPGQELESGSEPASA